jgi:hypothetical protein
MAHIASNAHGGVDAMICETPLWMSYAFMIFVPLLILPPTTSLAFGQVPRQPAASYLSDPITALGVPIGEGPASDRHGLIWNLRALASITATSIQPHGWLLGHFLAFRWTLADQRARCQYAEATPVLTRIGSSFHTSRLVRNRADLLQRTRTAA